MNVNSSKKKLIQVPSSCSFDRYFLEYLLRLTRLHSFHALFSLYALFSLNHLCQLYIKCIPYFADFFSKRSGVKKISMLNKNLVHLIDNIIWTMGFKPETKTRAKKVVPITHTTPIIFKQINYITCPNYFIKLGLFYLYSFLLGSNFLSPGISLVIHYYNHYAD
jgi:hypothetical protein